MCVYLWWGGRSRFPAMMGGSFRTDYHIACCFRFRSSIRVFHLRRLYIKEKEKKLWNVRIDQRLKTRREINHLPMISFIRTKKSFSIRKLTVFIYFFCAKHQISLFLSYNFVNNYYISSEYKNTLRYNTFFIYFTKYRIYLSTYKNNSNLEEDITI